MFHPLLRHSAKIHGLRSSRLFASFKPIAISRSIPKTTSLLLGTTISVIGFQTVSSSSKIYNDAAYKPSFNSISSSTSPKLDINTALKTPNNGSRSGLNYNELTIGSITGLFLGIIVGKLSTAIVFLTISGYLLTQFLESRGIINIPWNQVIRIGSENVDLKSLVFEKPNFKIPFVLTFIIAAYNI